MSTERIACPKCKGWMFHLAKKCPHCGAENTAAPGKVEMSGEEVRSLLVSATPRKPNASFSDISHEFVIPRDGPVELVLSIIAGPLTVSTVLTLGYLLLRQKRTKRDDALAGAQLLAVPACAAFIAVTLFQFHVPPWAWALFGVSLSAWAIRAFLRRNRSIDPLD